ncbi:MAG TPA: hypothetical protein VN643_09740 [Pyrinomonadaceae bacterium]|nr:hypothetical protein [Pyrinomonadaceae bacterium]
MPFKVHVRADFVVVCLLFGLLSFPVASYSASIQSATESVIGSRSLAASVPSLTTSPGSFQSGRLPRNDRNLHQTTHDVTGLARVISFDLPSGSLARNQGGYTFDSLSFFKIFQGRAPPVTSI